MLVSSTVILALSALSVTALPTINNKRWARPTVDLGYASYQGIYNETTNIQSFKGIRYAAPPLGDLRWKAPQSPTSLTGLQDASEYGQTCIQGTVGGSADQPVAGLLAAATASFATSSEDCLFINVFMPPNTTVGQASLLPVGVYIHGGGYTLGSGNDYDPTPLFAQSEGNYVWVTMNYRLNTFGFLAGNEIAAGGALNAGLLDQQAALQWVQTNIAKFGGDPSHVTIWGESAGAGSVYQQIVANGGNTQPPLFQGAILASAFEPPNYLYNASKPQVRYLPFTHVPHTATDDSVSQPPSQMAYDHIVTAANCTSATDTLSCLRKADAKLLALAGWFDTAQQTKGDWYYLPVIDGTFIQERPEASLAQGKVNGDRIWAAHNFNEGLVGLGQNSSFTPQTIGNSSTAQRAWLSSLMPNLSNTSLTAIQDAYNAETFGSLQIATDLIYGEGIFGCQALWIAEAFPGNSYLAWLVVPGYNKHADDTTLAFAGKSNTLVGTPYEAISKSWIENHNSFITSYTLNADYAVSTFDAGSPQQVVVNTTSSLAPDIGYDAVPADFIARCNLWRSLAPVVPF
ncbi:hypothetical protein QFC24_004459 [Naganishia onofrii]|uniref:Uncharacterized protein n=1 Tax=Naganishia onofrii TaxID=1851511 RepID=A0ACC2XGM1_9TREE|nr:hypothetical protein QFC24_004459 [Naganishia onofrii]